MRQTTDLNNIRCKLGVAARVREKTKCKSFQDLPKPKNCDEIVAAVAAATQISKESDQLGLTFGGYIKQLSMLKLAEAIKQRNCDDKEDAEEFRWLFETFWTPHVTSVTAKRQRLNTLNKREELPLSEDLQTYSKFLRNSIPKESNIDLLSRLCLSFFCPFQ